MALFGIVGAGLMGHGIAAALARAGHHTRLHDPDPAVLGDVHDRVERALELSGTPEAARMAVQDHISAVPDLDAALHQVDVVVEAVPERMAVKHEVVAAVEALVPPRTPIWSNTSVLSITGIADGMRHPERLVGVHWWNPAHLIPLVEIAPGAATDPAFVRSAHDLVTSLGKTAVRLHRDVPGFIGNRLQFAMVREALHLLDEGVCDAETIDTVVRGSFGLRLAAVGPMENADHIGLDLTRSILANLAPHLSTATDAFPTLDKLLTDGHRGRTTGRGLLDWTGPHDVTSRLIEGIRRNLPAR
ncbi:3-hydroxyacyl-CoA dehydrogenase family protein [Saccharothrix variisporea]|uniref:3-hydroxybutyryl-CoA dehydrogenase n=1 Tax=Saccharothrix variisporea TaxID=543527 RepID=A0A495XQ95_9PSEU|nr:3-hydroxyacyl-CoA dehydrogenase family protein [Saccharothrix variisporea]RKT75084.1 3-hydroxybutyryl-CoA dehydrogenase [Saccharothrix variisporea]